MEKSCFSAIFHFLQPHPCLSWRRAQGGVSWPGPHSALTEATIYRRGTPSQWERVRNPWPSLRNSKLLIQHGRLAFPNVPSFLYLCKQEFKGDIITGVTIQLVCVCHKVWRAKRFLLFFGRLQWNLILTMCVHTTAHAWNWDWTEVLSVAKPTLCHVITIVSKSMELP